MADDIFNLGFAVDTTALAQGKASAADLAKALLEVAKAMQTQEAASKKAGEAEKKRADETKKAADETKKTADPSKALADSLNVLGQRAVGVSGYITGMTQSIMQAGQSLSQGGGGGLLGGMNSFIGLGGRMIPMMGGMAAGFASVALGVLAAAGAYGALVAATYKQQEAFLMLEGRLKNVYGSASVAAEMFKELTVLADKNGLSIDATAESFLRLARNNEAIGLTRKEMLGLTDAVQMLGRVSGASQGEVAGGLMQFSQALAAGRLNGDELRSIMENMPALTKAIADGLGVSVGQLRAMGAEGQLTSEKITGALLGQLPKIREEFDNLPQTSEQAFQRVGNAWDTLVARMGDRLNSSGIVTTAANALADVIGGAAEAIRPETPEEVYQRIMQRRASGAPPRNASFGIMGMGVATYQAAERDEEIELQRAMAEMEAARMLRRQGQIDEEKATMRAPFVRAQGLMKETDDFANKLTALRENLRAFKDARDKLTEGGKNVFQPEELKKLDDFNRLIAVTEAQIASTLLPLEKFAQTTDRMAANVARYGAGGAASIGTEAQGLVDASIAAQQPITFGEAEAEVMRRRTVDLQTQTQAMDLQIAAQEKLRAAIGGGTQAQIEAEVATKALNLQMQLFGADLGPDAAKAMDAYREKLREVLTITREVADATKQNNAQQELAIERALLAAQQNGANAGQLREIERNLRLINQLQEAGGVAVAPGGVGAGFVGPMPLAGNGVIPADRIDGNTVTAGLEASIRATVSAVMATYPQVTGISGLRPEDKGSQHSVGTAFDLDISRLTEDQKMALVQQLLSGAYGRIGGIGTYNADATSLHIDTREGRMAWGPNKSKSSLNQTPDWFEAMTTAWMSGKDVGGSGVGAALAEGELTALRARREEEARLIDLQKERALLQKQIAAGTISEATAAAREKAARDYAAQFTDATRQAQAYQQKLEELRLRDELAAAEKMRALDEEVRQSEARLKIAGLTGKAREIELRVLEQINAEEAAGREVSAEREAAIRERVTILVNNDQAEKDAQEAAGKVKSVWDTAADAIGSSLEEAIRQAMETGKVDAEDILKGLLADITTAIMRTFIIQPLVSGIQGLMAAHGAVIGGGQQMAFAAGGVVAQPTVFPMARGAGLMGEAGPEAILPLKRGPDGKLGVGAGSGGGGTQIVVNDMRTTQGAEPVDVQETQGPDGQRMISILVRDEVRRQVRSGELDKEMRTSFGMNRQLTRR